MRWSSGGLRVETAERDGVLHMDFSGLVTPGSLAEFIRGGPGVARGTHAMRIDLTRAFLVLDFDAYVAALAEAGVAERFQAPAAVLCRPDDLPPVKAYARGCAAAGIVRVALTSEQCADEWCRARVKSARLASLLAAERQATFRVC